MWARRSAPRAYNGKVYRPEGPAWPGVPYDASRHRTVEVGTFYLRFEGEGATFGYAADGRTGETALSRIPF